MLHARTRAARICTQYCRQLDWSFSVRIAVARSVHGRASEPLYLGSVSSITEAACSQARAISKHAAPSLSSSDLRANWTHSRAYPLHSCDEVMARPSAHDFPICRIANVKKPRVNPKGSATTVPMKKLAISNLPDENQPAPGPRHAMHVGVRFWLRLRLEGSASDLVIA